MKPEPGISAASQGLVEELMGAVVALSFVLQMLIDLPAEALPGENRAEAMRDLLTASACCEVEVVGEEACRATTALVEAVVARIVDDATGTAELVRASADRPC
jgi:hypothetical protein